MKKILAVFLSVFLLSSVFAWNYHNNWYKSPIYLDEFNFDAKLDNNVVYMNWNGFYDIVSDESLKYYKVVRSHNNVNPVYPDDGYIKYSSDADFTSFKDYDFKKWANYYRVCAITNDNDRYCSNVVKIRIENNNVYEDKYNKKYEKKNEYNDKQKDYEYKKEKDNLNYKTSLKIDKVINTFILKLDKKEWYSNTDKYNKIKTVISNLEKLKTQKPELENIIKYMVKKLEQKMKKYKKTKIILILQ